MNILEAKRKLLPMSGPQGDSGGGGGGPPEKQTQVVDLPEWAKPSAQRVLAKGEAITATPYQAYRGERIAQFTPLQQQAFGSAEQLAPSQAGQMGIGVAGEAAGRALGARYNPYQTGGFGQQAGEYMSPFIQQALEPQMREARRASEIQRQADQARAVGQGAFGGSRQAIVEAERQRNLGTQLGDIQARGLQTAFDQGRQQFNTEQQLREQSRQYGAGLGMQGLQTALQGASQLGSLGGQQFGQQREAIGLQSQLGTQQQQQVQNVLSQQYQDFLNQQRHPYQQLEFMSNLLRGTPMGTVQTLYSPPPNMMGQLAGLGAGFAGMAGSRGFAEGGSVTSDEYVADVLGNLSDQQLAQARQEAMQRQDANRIEMIDQELAKRASIRQGVGSAFNALPEEDQERVISAASGGIVAFSNGDLVTDTDAGTALDSARAQARAAQQRLYTYGLRQRQQDPAGFEAAQKELASARDVLRNAEQSYSAQIASSGANRAAFGMPTAPAQREPAPAATSGLSAAAPAFQPKVQQADLRRIDQAISEKPSEKPPEVKLSRSERSAVNKVATAMATQAPVEKSSVKSEIEAILRPGKAEDADSFNKIMSQIKEMTKLPEYDKNEALAKFGFAMALAASKPGARFLSSVSEAAPQFLAHREEYRKKADESRKLAGQMGIEQAKLELANRREDRKTAADAALRIKQLELQEEKNRQDAAYQRAAANKPTGLMAVYEELKRANPDAAPEALLRKASEISGFSYRTEALERANKEKAIAEVEKQYKMFEAFPVGNPMRVQAEAKKKEAIDRILAGGPQGGGVTSPMPQGVTVQRLGN